MNSSFEKEFCFCTIMCVLTVTRWNITNIITNIRNCSLCLMTAVLLLTACNFASFSFFYVNVCTRLDRLRHLTQPANRFCCEFEEMSSGWSNPNDLQRSCDKETFPSGLRAGAQVKPESPREDDGNDENSTDPVINTDTWPKTPRGFFLNLCFSRI